MWNIHLHHKKKQWKKNTRVWRCFSLKWSGVFRVNFSENDMIHQLEQDWWWLFQRLQGSPSPHKKNISYFIIFHLEHIWARPHLLPQSSTPHKKSPCPKQKLRGGFKSSLFLSRSLGEDSQFDEHIFQMGWWKTTNQLYGIFTYMYHKNQPFM